MQESRLMYPVLFWWRVPDLKEFFLLPNDENNLIYLLDIIGNNGDTFGEAQKCRSDPADGHNNES